MAVVELSEKGTGQRTQLEADRLLDSVVERSMTVYARNLSRLAGDFGAAVAFLLSDSLFEKLGCGGHRFVQAAKQAYAVQGPVSIIEVRKRSRQLIAETDGVLKVLGRAAAKHRRLLERQRKTGEALADAADRVTQEIEAMLQEGLQAIAAEAAQSGADDPEDLSTKLSELAGKVFSHMRQVWEPIYADLANASLPPPPLVFSGRQIYIETVKVFNQHRLAFSESPAADSGRLRGLFGSRRPPARQAAAGEPAAELINHVVSGIGDVIRGAVQGWQRGALERAQRKGLETSSAIGEAALVEEFGLIERTIAQLLALRTELARGMSVRHYYLVLLKQAASCSRSA